MSEIVEYVIKSTENEWLMNKQGNTPYNSFCVAYHISVFNMACVGLCEFDITPFLSSPNFVYIK